MKAQAELARAVRTALIFLSVIAIVGSVIILMAGIARPDETQYMGYGITGLTFAIPGLVMGVIVDIGIKALDYLHALVYDEEEGHGD